MGQMILMIFETNFMTESNYEHHVGFIKVPHRTQ